MPSSSDCPVIHNSQLSLLHSAKLNTLTLTDINLLAKL